ncbi:hypothetical protein QF019_002369 [Pseudomonas frederiksbergensis]
MPLFMGGAPKSGAGLAKVIVQRASDEVHRNVLLRLNGRDFETAYDKKVSLAQPGRLFFLCLSHSRVVHCDFIES